VFRYLVGNLTPERWYIAPEVGWLGPADVQGDALRDLRVTDGELSVLR